MDSTNNLGLVHVWQQGDWVTKTVASILLIMSLASWLVMLVKAMNILRHKKQMHQSQTFWTSPDLEAGIRGLGDDAENPFYSLAVAGREAAAHHRSTQHQLNGKLDFSDWMTRGLRNAIDDSTAKLQSGLAVLASVGSTAPFVGLFGTVWGIYHALLGIGVAGQATIDKVAGPIGEALIMTALGLAVAIPAVLGYNALVRGNKSIIAKLNRFAHDLHAYFVTGTRVSSGTTVVPLKRA